MSQDVVCVLRCPDEPDMRHLQPGAVLVSMLHLATRPERAELMAALGVHGVSMDGLVDERGVRLVQNLEATAWNGVREAFRALAGTLPSFSHQSRRPLHVTCLGAGGVAGHAVRAWSCTGDSWRRCSRPCSTVAAQPGCVRTGRSTSARSSARASSAGSA